MKRIIKIQAIRTFVKTATIELELSSDSQLDEVADFLYDTRNEWEELMEKQLEKAQLESDPELDDCRYDVYEQVVLEKKVYGGTL